MYDGIAVYEPGEYCVACGSVEDLGEAEMPGGVNFTVCQPCHDGPGFREWLAAEIEDALRESPEYERRPDGKWVHVPADEIPGAGNVRE